VHPKTGKICVPLDPNNIMGFDVENVPTLTQAINEMGGADCKKGSSHEPKCLEQPLRVFKAFLKSLDDDRKKEELRSRKEANKESTDF
jgi:DNA primase small subunit